MPLGPNPAYEQGYDVILFGETLRVLPGTYGRKEAERFAPRIVQGDPAYVDFDAQESAVALTHLTGGYGLKAHSDHPDEEAAITGLDVNTPDGADTRGVPLVGWPLDHTVELGATNGRVAWIGEFAGQLVIIAGTRIATWDGVAASATITGLVLPATPEREAIGVFNGKLVIGFGADATAIFTTDLLSSSPVLEGTDPIYIHAFTADRAAAYAAGGPDPLQVNRIVSSPNGGSEYAGAVLCTGTDFPITGLAPGGNVAIVYVGRNNELGCIGVDAQYHVLLPFDSVLSSNGTIMQWYLGDVSQQQQGPLILLYSRDRRLHMFTPDAELQGTSANISPEARGEFVDTRGQAGRPVAVQGTARWLYALLRTSDGTTTIQARDARTGNWHILGSGDMLGDALMVSSLGGGDPRLFFGMGSETTIGWHNLPLDGDLPRGDNPLCDYQPRSTFRTPRIDLRFPNMDKVYFKVDVLATQLEEEVREVEVEASIEDDDWILLGTAFTDRRTTLLFPQPAVGKDVRLRVSLTTTTPGLSPQLWGLIIYCALVPDTPHVWTFDAAIEGGYHAQGMERDNAKRVAEALWAAKTAGIPGDWQDLWGTTYTARIVDMEEKWTLYEPQKTPQVVLHISVREIGEGEDTLLTVSAPDAESSFLPIEL